MNRKEYVKELFNNGAGRICKDKAYFELKGDYVVGKTYVFGNERKMSLDEFIKDYGDDL
ncbi:MAG: hypothetical protein ACOC80_10805 [Petrotogales bacterium]